MLKHFIHVAVGTPNSIFFLMMLQNVPAVCCVTLALYYFLLEEKRIFPS